MKHDKIKWSENAAWVWPADMGDTPNQYVQFRHEFDLAENAAKPQIQVSCDSNYALWVNGKFVNYGQWHDYPDHKTCDVLPLTGLRRGKNVLAFMVYYQGEGSFQYIKAPPGLLYMLKAGKTIVSSGRDSVCRRDSGYTQGPIERITGQLGFPFRYDAKDEDGWRSLDYRKDKAWASPALTPVKDRPVESMRPVHKLRVSERLKPTIKTQGVFTRKLTGEHPIAEFMQTDFLSTRHRSEILDGMTIKADAAKKADGVYLVLDLGREEAGLLDLDIEAAAGTVLDIAWGEHLDDMRVRAHVGGRCFGARYVCGEGRKQFTHYFTRLAGQYIQIHISNITKDVTLYYAGLIPVEYPLEVKGLFESSDSLYNRIYDVSVRTLHLCMHEHYEDCPWREQALYAMDMRNQALAGYYTFGEYTFPVVSLDLLAKGLKPDGFLEMCAPAEINITIPVFTLAWVLAVADHYLYSGDKDAAKRMFPVVKAVLDKCAESSGDGLLPSPTGDRYWHFYDWADGLSGDGFAKLGTLRYDAPLNMFYILALEAGERIANAVGEFGFATMCSRHASAVRPQIHERFWDADGRSYITFSGEGAPLHRSELVQALAILAGVCGAHTAALLRERLADPDNGMVATTLSYSLYKFEALLADPDRYGQRVLDKLSADWGHMLFSGATSFWETIKGSSDFGDGGSLCHGWSGIPAYFYHAYVLGVKPSSPGFRTFRHAPLRDVGVSAEGVVPTPHGPITVGKALSYPAGTSPDR